MFLRWITSLELRDEKQPVEVFSGFTDSLDSLSDSDESCGFGSRPYARFCRMQMQFPVDLKQRIHKLD